MADISIPELARSLVVPGIVFFIVSIVSFETIWFIAVDVFSLTRGIAFSTALPVAVGLGIAFGGSVWKIFYWPNVHDE